MALQISPPEQFNADHPENWTTWIRRFERYRVASSSKLVEESQENQVNMML